MSDTKQQGQFLHDGDGDGDGMEKNNTHLKKRRRRCLIVSSGLIIILLLFIIIIIILAFTVFKPKQPKTEILSASIDGVAPLVSFPAINIKLNLTLDLKLLVHNYNHASFKHGYGKSYLMYRGAQVGDADLYPGLVPAMGTETLPARLTLQLDKVASDISALVSDLLGGQIALQTHTNIPGRVTFLGFIKKHVVATSKCQLVVALPAMKVFNLTCETKTHL